MSIVLFFVSASILFLDSKGREKREKAMYIFLAAVSVILAFAAGLAAENDHVGASLSGMISIFMR